ncbi:unnamed protein product [Rhodiola kirilowii]
MIWLRISRTSSSRRLHGHPLSQKSAASRFGEDLVQLVFRQRVQRTAIADKRPISLTRVGRGLISNIFEVLDLGLVD